METVNRERYSVTKGRYRKKEKTKRHSSPIAAQCVVSALLVALGFGVNALKDSTSIRASEMLGSSLTVEGDLGDVSRALNTFAANFDALANDPLYTAPVKGTLTDGFGQRVNPVTQESSFHYGIDISAEEGAPIAAAADGQAVFCGDDEYYGNYIILDHGSDTYTVYGHCKEILIAEGQQIKAGDKIGLVGTSGQSTGFHLHFGIKMDGSYVDPLDYIEL